MNTIGIVLNKKAKNADQITPYLEAFTQAGFNYTLYKTSPYKLSTVIKNCIKAKQTLIIAGGDGTVRTAAQQCIRYKVPLAILPLGTLNHFVSDLGLPGTPEDLVVALTKNVTVTVDVATVNRCIFVNNSSIGFYPKFAQRRDVYAQRYNKWLSYIPGFIDALQRYETFRVSVQSENIDLTCTTSFLMISNNLYAYEFPTRFERPSLRQAKLGLYCLKSGAFMKIIDRFVTRKKNRLTYTSKEPIIVDIKDRKTVRVSLDGETKIMKLPLRYQSLPQSLTLFKRSS